MCPPLWKAFHKELEDTGCRGVCVSGCQVLGNDSRRVLVVRKHSALGTTDDGVAHLFEDLLCMLFLVELHESEVEVLEQGSAGER